MARTVKKKNNKTTEVLASQIISCKDLARQMVLDNKDGQRFCFILGSGASIESGIPTGYKLEMAWMDYLMGRGRDVFDLTEGSNYGERADQLLSDHTEDETRDLASRMFEDKRLKHPFSEIEAAWQETLDNTKNTSRKYNFSEYYFDIYRLRFSTDETSGYRYLERIMEKCKPSIGYHTLAHLLTKTNQNNLVITTNFDSLVEDALFLYTDKKPLVVNHESLAKFIDPNIQRPMVAKVHRGLFYDPMNSPDLKLSDGWKKELEHLFAQYTPIVIGYGGGDRSLMDFLEQDTPRRIYWSFLGGIEGVPDRIKKMVTNSSCGRFVSIKGFDSMMLELGKALFGPEALTPTTVMQHFDKHMAEFTSDWSHLEQRENLKEELKEIFQCEEEMKKKRKTEKHLTAWDHFQTARDYQNKNKYKEAIREYSAAIALKPDYAVAYYNRGHAYEYLGEHQQAIADFDKAIALKPDVAAAYHSRGYEYGNQGEYQQAITDFDKAIALKPDFAGAYNNRGYAYAVLGECQKAIADFEAAIALEPDSANPHRHLGNIYADQGNTEKALEELTKAISLNADYLEAYEDRAKVYDAMGQKEHAEADRAKAEELRKKNKPQKTP